MLIDTQVQDARKWAQTNLATTSYSVTIGMTTTEPVASATRAIIDMANGGIVSRSILECIPYGTGANNAVITGFRVYGWKKVPGTGPGTSTLTTWVPRFLFELACVFGNIAGPANGILTTTDFLMDTLTAVNPTTLPASVEIDNPVTVANDLPTGFRFDTRGFHKLELVVDLGANATGFNCLVWGY